MWAVVIFHSIYYYLHNSTYECENNCWAYGKTQKWFDSKHFCVLIGITHFCFQSVGPVCWIHFWRDRLLQHNTWFQENMEWRQNLFFSARSALPPPLSHPIQCLPDYDKSPFFPATSKRPNSFVWFSPETPMDYFTASGKLRHFTFLTYFWHDVSKCSSHVVQLSFI